MMMMIFYLFLQKQQTAYRYIPVWIHLREIKEKTTRDDVAIMCGIMMLLFPVRLTSAALSTYLSTTLSAHLYK